MSEVPFHLIGTSDLHVKVQNERFTAVGSRYHQSLKFGNFEFGLLAIRSPLDHVFVNTK